MTGSYNNFFRCVLPRRPTILQLFESCCCSCIFIFVKLFFCRMFDRSSRKEVTLEASREVAKPKTMLKPRKVQKNKIQVSDHYLRCALVARGKRTRSLLIALISTRRFSTLHGIHRFAQRWHDCIRLMHLFAGEHHCGCCHKQSLPLPGDFLTLMLFHRHLENSGNNVFFFQENY